MSEWVSAGKVRMTPKGIHNSAIAYEILDVVLNTSETALYIAKKDVPINTVLTNTEYWEPIINLGNIGEEVDDLESRMNTLEDDVDDSKELIQELQEQTNSIDEIAIEAYHSKSVSGNIVTFEDSANNVPVKALTVEVNPVQSGDNPSPDNVCSISGWTGAKITRCGKNLISWPTLDTSSQNGIAAQINSDGKLSLSGTASANVGGLYTSTKENNYNTMHLGPFPAGTYTITCHGFVGTSVDDRIIINMRYADNSYVRNGFRISGEPGAVATGEGYAVTFTATSEFKMFVYIYIAAGTTMDCSATIQMERGELLGDWEPYTGDTWNFDWADEAGTVYSGTLDVTTGVLTVDKACVEFDGSSDEIIYSELDGQRAKIINGAPGVEAMSGRIPVMCNIGTTSSGSAPNTVFAYADGGIFYYFPTTPMTVEQFRAQLAATPMQVVYKLATPVIYELTPIQIKSILGSNIIYADCGDTSVTYCVDPMQYSVTSVAGKTGAVVLTSADIPFEEDGDSTDKVISDLQEALSASEAQRIAMYPTITTSGSIISITDGAEDVPVKDLVIGIEPVQAAGTPTPETPLPISGWTGAKVTRNGSNLADISKIVGNQNATVTFPETGVCRIVTDGQNTYRAANIRPTDMTYPAGTYYVKFKVKANPVVNDYTLVSLRTVAGNNLKGNLVHISASTTDQSYEAVFTTTEDTYFSYVANGNTTGAEYGTDVTIYDLMVSKLDVPYEPYVGKTYSIDWTEEAGTVYGGTLNVTTGVLTVDRAFLETTWGAGTFYKSVGNTITGKLFEGLQRFNSTNITTNNSVCNVCPPNIDEMNLESPHFYLIDQISAGMVHNKAYVYLPNDTSDDQVIQIAYPIKTPITYNLTPIELRTLLGKNTIYTDCGNISLEYRADMTSYYLKVKSVAGKIGDVELDGGDVGFSITAQYISNTVGAILREVYDNLYLVIQDVGRLEIAVDSTKMLVYNQDGTVTWEDAPS